MFIGIEGKGGVFFDVHHYHYRTSLKTSMPGYQLPDSTGGYLAPSLFVMWSYTSQVVVEALSRSDLWHRTIEPYTNPLYSEHM